MAYLTYKATRESKKATGGRKQTIAAITHSEPTIRLSSDWSGGSRTLYQAVNSSGRVGPLPDNASEYRTSWAQAGPSIRDWPIPAGLVVLETGTFCGRPATPTLVGEYSDVQRVLEAWGIDANNPKQEGKL